MNGGQGFDAIAGAARYALNLYKTLKGCGLVEVEEDGRVKAPGLYTRARSLPPLLAQSGLAPVTAFALSKAEDLRAVEAAFKVMGGAADVSREDLEKLADDASKSGRGYAIMAALIARTLKDSGAAATVGCGDQSTPVAVWLADCVLKIIEQGGPKALAIESTVLTVMQEFKKYIEAFVKKPEREE